MDVAILQEEDSATGAYHTNCALSGEFRWPDPAVYSVRHTGSVATVLTFVTFSSAN